MVRVLVFDESPLVGMLVEHCLKKHGWIVEAHGYGSELHKKIVDFMPDVVLLDPNTPGLEPVTAVRILSDTKAERGYKLICLSCYSSCAYSMLAIENLIDGHFIKRYSLEGLKDVIMETLSGP